ncbi:MAG: hypothetical protein IPM16_23785 [Chloroflexi bacterium]|nr:hypothetical protein [Chloroflexota bacterium]
MKPSRLTRLFLFAVLLAALLSTTLAQGHSPRALPNIPLHEPENGEAVFDPAVSLVWDFIPEAALYAVTVKNVNGSQSIKLIATGVDCFMLRCATVLDSTVNAWVWNEGDTYSWSVKAKDGAGQAIAKSNKRTFVVDMLQPLTLDSPANGATVAAFNVAGIYLVTIQFHSDDVVMSYIGTMYRQDGSTVGTTNLPNSNCSISCPMYMIVDTTATGVLRKYTWKVIGTRAGVKGKAKSPTFSMKVYIP